MLGSESVSATDLAVLQTTGRLVVTKQSVGKLIALYFATVVLAAAGRVEHFPFTWAPMYALRLPELDTPNVIPLNDRERIRREGISVVRRNGSTSALHPNDLNLPRSSFNKLYFQRVFRVGPPNIADRNHPGWTVERWLERVGHSEPSVRIDWHRRLLVTFNKTLDLEPDDPEFITRIPGHREKIHIDPETFSVERRFVVRDAAVWNESWSRDFDRESH